MSTPWKAPPNPFGPRRVIGTPSLVPASRILLAAHDSATSFYNLFDFHRHEAKGTTADYEQDLLRAMLVFASAALDNLMKRVVRDALPLVIERDAGAQKKLRDFAESRIGRRVQSLEGASVVIDHKFLVALLLAPSPRAGVVDALISELTANSLQSKAEVMKILDYFSIDRAKVCPDLTKLDEAFRVRNQIVHEMDVNLTAKRRSRTSRRLADMLDHATLLLNLGAAFLAEVDRKLAQPSVDTNAPSAPVLGPG